jgi:SOS-response transcriptional repressor LexA
MIKDNNILRFDERNKLKTKTRWTSELRKPVNPEVEVFCLNLVGDCLAPFFIRDGDIILVQADPNDIRNGDLAVVKYHGQNVAFMVYFDGDNVVLHGEKVEVFERSKVEFVGRVIRLERDF